MSHEFGSRVEGHRRKVLHLLFIFCCCGAVSLIASHANVWLTFGKCWKFKHRKLGEISCEFWRKFPLKLSTREKRKISGDHLCWLSRSRSKWFHSLPPPLPPVYQLLSLLGVFVWNWPLNSLERCLLNWQYQGYGFKVWHIKIIF